MKKITVRFAETSAGKPKYSAGTFLGLLKTDTNEKSGACSKNSIYANICYIDSIIPGENGTYGYNVASVIPFGEGQTGTDKSITKHRMGSMKAAFVESKNYKKMSMKQVLNAVNKRLWEIKKGIIF